MNNEIPIKVEKIEDQKNVTWEMNSKMEKVDNTNYDKANNHMKQWLNDNGKQLTDFFDAIKIIQNPDGSFFLCGDKSNGNKEKIIQIKDINLLKGFIYNFTDVCNRAILTTIGGDIHDKFDIEEITTTDPKTNEITTELVLKRTELDKLKGQIGTLDEVIKLSDIILNIQKKDIERHIKTAQKTADRENNIIMKENLDIFRQVLKAQCNHVNFIQSEAKSSKKDKFKQNHDVIIGNRVADLDRITSQLARIDEYTLDHSKLSKTFDDKESKMDLALFSSKDVIKLQKKLGIQDTEIKAINLGEFNCALILLDSEEQTLFKNYLDNVISGIVDPTTNKYDPQNKEKFEELCIQYPFLRGYLKTDKNGNLNGGKKTGSNNNNNSPTNNPNNNQGPENNDNGGKKKYNSRQEALAEGKGNGLINYWLDKTNMSPQQKDFWNGAGNVAITGGLIFVGFKAITSAFKLFIKKGREDTSNRGRVLGPLGIMFVANAWAGKSSNIPTKIANIFGYNKNASPDALTYSEGFVGLSALFSNQTYETILPYLEKNGDRIKISDTGYDNLMQLYSSGAQKNDVAVSFLKSIGKEDKKNLIDLAFVGMGITRDKLKDPANKTNSFNEIASEAIVRLKSVSDFMETNKYTKINSETMPLIKKYIASGSSGDLDKLAERGDVFEKDQTLSDITSSKKIKDISKQDTKKEELLLKATNKFYEIWPTTNKSGLDLYEVGGKMLFKTYNQTTEIDLNSKILVGLKNPSGGELQFDSYLELFKVANLTNALKNIFKDKEANNKADPFHVETIGNIEFDNSAWYQFWKPETTAVSSTYFKDSLEKISPILNNNKDPYCNYLNGLKFWKNT